MKLGESLASDENHSLGLKCLWKCTQAKGALAWVYATPRKGYTLTEQTISTIIHTVARRFFNG
jgi:hypothetical protein